MGKLYDELHGISQGYIYSSLENPVNMTLNIQVA